MLDLRELWSYRELLRVLTLRDIRVRYKQTTLGVLWAVLQPTLTMLIFSVIFGRLAKLPSEGVPYPVWVLSGLLPWMFFAQAVSGAGASIVSSGPLITRVYFPRLTIPLASIGVALVDFAVALLVLLALSLWYGISPGPSILLAPLLVLAAVITALGVGTCLAAATVEHRDLRHVQPFLLQIWMFATPVVYPAALIPDRWRWAIYLNPMTGVVEGFRASWLGLWVDWGLVATSNLIGLLLLGVGLLVFSRTERRFADVV